MNAVEQRSRWMPSHRKGFTLVEMLVVIFIILLLMSLLLPALIQSRESGRSTQCKSNLRQLHLGLTRFRDLKGNYPPYRWEDPTVVNKYGVVRPRWQWIISDFLGRPAQNPDAITLATHTLGYDDTFTTLPLDNEIFSDPALPDQNGIRNGAYGYNFQYLGNSRNLVDGDITTPMLNYPVRRIQDSSRTICFGDSRGGNVPHGGHSMTLDPPHMRPRTSGVVDSPSPSRSAGFDPYGPDETGTDIVIYFSPVEERHDGRANVIYLDGHVESHTLVELGYRVDAMTGQALPQNSDHGTSFPTSPGPIGILQATFFGNNAQWNGYGVDEASVNYTKVQSGSFQ